MSTAEHVLSSWGLAKGSKLQAKYSLYKSGPAVMPDIRDVTISQLRPAGLSWWPLILRVGQNNLFSWKDSDFYALSSLSVTNASWGNWDQGLHCWCPSSLVCDALQLPHDSFFFLGTSTLGGNRTMILSWYGHVRVGATGDKRISL